jgi:membrane peptidoglycan carboxypeptidase
VIATETARRLRRMLQAVTGEEGTGRAANVPGYTVGGKTGTAQKVDASGRYARGRYVSWFAGFVPAEDPSLAIVVMVDEPRGPRFHGGDVSAPVFARVALPALQYLGVSPDRDGTLVFDRSLQAWSQSRDDRRRGPAVAPARTARGRAHASPAAVPAVQRAGLLPGILPARRAAGPPPAGSGPVAMPDLTGLSLRRATETLAGLGLTCRHEARGARVTRQEPPPGEPMGPATPCRVIY